MDAIYLWPDRPALSLFVLWLASLLVLWAARAPMQSLLSRLGAHLEDGFAGAADWCRKAAEDLRERNRAALLAAGELELRDKLERELHRIDQGFSERLGQYSELHRRLDDTLQRLDDEYRRCGEVPPEVPGWTSAVETISSLPTSGDPNVQKILEGIRKSLQDAEKKALQAHRDDSSKRHKLLGGMLPSLKDIRGLMARMMESVGKALDTTTRVNGYVDEYGKLREDSKDAARALTHSAAKLFFVSLLVLGIALGGAFINFQLIALPMSELVPAGARLGGVPVATVSALIIVLMEIAVGIFVMDMLGITELFPKLSRVPASRRRMILALALAGLFFLAAVESSLAILREQIVEADAALKHALAGVDSATVVAASSSRIPVIGQAVLGFVLPWILALVAIPLEMLLDSGRHVVASTTVFALATAANLARVIEHAARSLFDMLPSVYDVYIAIPLRMEGMLRGGDVEPASSKGRRRGKAAGPAATPVPEKGVA